MPVLFMFVGAEVNVCSTVSICFYFIVQSIFYPNLLNTFDPLICGITELSMLSLTPTLLYNVLTIDHSAEYAFTDINTTAFVIDHGADYAFTHTHTSALVVNLWPEYAFTHTHTTVLTFDHSAEYAFTHTHTSVFVIDHRAKYKCTQTPTTVLLVDHWCFTSLQS